MSRFRFRLERVLAFRETQLSMEKSALARMHVELNNAEGALRDLHSGQARETELLVASRLLRGSDFARLASGRKWAEQEEKRLQTSIAGCQRNIEVQNVSVMEAQRKVRLLQRLKERREAAWMQEQNRLLEELAAESALGSWRRDAARSGAQF
jgi:flagellar biosynthesis chaperone FliJ